MPTIDEINDLLGVKTYNLKNLRQQRRTVLIHGRTGVGKTHQASLLPKVLYENVERGEATLAGGDITAIDVRTWKKHGQLMARVAELAKAGKSPFENIFIDSAPELAKIHLRAMAKKSAEAHPNLNPNQPMLSDYLDAMVDHDNMLMWFKDIPLNIIMTAISEYEKDDKGVMMWQPSLPPAIRKSFLQYSDAVWYMGKDSQGYRYLQTQGTAEVEAKTRNPLGVEPLPDKIYHPNTGDILSYFNGDTSIKFLTSPTGQEE